MRCLSVIFTNRFISGLRKDLTLLVVQSVHVSLVVQSVHVLLVVQSVHVCDLTGKIILLLSEIAYEKKKKRFLSPVNLVFTPHLRCT